MQQSVGSLSTCTHTGMPACRMLALTPCNKLHHYWQPQTRMLAQRSLEGSCKLRRTRRQPQQPSDRRHRLATKAGDSPPWTLDQVAGLAFGAFLILCVYLARQIDVIVARSQRRELGLCEECGGLFQPETCEEWRCPMKD